MSFSCWSGIDVLFSLLSGIGESFSLWPSGLLAMTSVTLSSRQMSEVSLMDAVEEISSNSVYFTSFHFVMCRNYPSYHDGF